MGKKEKVGAEVAEKARETAPQPSLADLLQAMTNRPSAQVAQVGIRNVCGNSVGIPPFGNEPGFQLFPFSPTEPNSMAVISWPRWQALRKNTLYGQGMIERFDEILDESAPRAPADKPHECHPDHDKNKVVDPHVWIAAKTDSELRAAILAMTSESQLQRLMYAVDQKCKEIETELRASGDTFPNSSPAEKAIEELPVSYQLTERIVQWRLGQILRPGTDDMLPKRSDLRVNKP